MKYALLIYSNEAPDADSKLSEAEQNAIMREYFAISELPATFGGAQLQPPRRRRRCASTTGAP